MTGLEKMIDQILDDAKREASSIMEKAKSESENILSAAKEECRKLNAESEVQIVDNKKIYLDRIRSSVELRKRQAVLAAKQQIIADVLDKAYHTMCAMDDDAYFNLIKKMLDKFALAKSGEVCFSPKDLKRMPSGFEAVIAKAAGDKGGTLALSKEEKNIEGGFILIYGGIEENCSFKALFNAQRDELSDKVHGLLFT